MIMMEDPYQNIGVTCAFPIMILVLLGGGNSLVKWLQRSTGNYIPQDDNTSRMEGPYQKNRKWGPRIGEGVKFYPLHPPLAAPLIGSQLRMGQRTWPNLSFF